MAKENMNTTTSISLTPREIDFVTRFANSWEHLREILGIMRPIRMTPGTVLSSKTAKATLKSGVVAEGEEAPYSKIDYEEKEYEKIEIERYAKGVSIQAIAKYGYDVAVAMSDDAFLFELQTNVTGRFYTYLNTGTLKGTYANFKMALAMAKGMVENKFKTMRKTATDTVGFVNVLDVYEYLGGAEVTVQNKFGFQYIKDFMGYGTIFVLGENEIARGRVIATPVENIAMYYIDPADSDFARAGLQYTVDGETNLIGVHMMGDYGKAVSETQAILGLRLFAEYIDAIAVVTIGEAGA